MPDIVLHELSSETVLELQLRAQQNRRSAEAEAAAIVEEAILKSKYRRIATEQGLGSALKELGREFNITNEFDGLRDADRDLPPRS